MNLTKRVKYRDFYIENVPFTIKAKRRKSIADSVQVKIVIMSHHKFPETIWEKFIEYFRYYIEDYIWDSRFCDRSLKQFIKDMCYTEYYKKSSIRNALLNWEDL